MVDVRVKIEIDLVAEMVVHVFKHLIVYVGSEVAHRCVKELKSVLNTHFFELRAVRGVDFRTLSAVLHVDFVNIVHEFKSLVLADMLIERAAEIVCYIVFSVRESARAAETAHDRAGLAPDAGFYLVAVDGTFSAFQLVTCLKNRYLQPFVCLCQLVSGENTARTRADDDNVIFHV